MIAAGRGGLGGGCQAKVAPPNVPGVETKTARLLLRQQLHLNLNLNVQETLRDGVDIDDVDEDVGDDEEEATTTTTSERLSIVATGDNLQTVTTVPQTNEQLKAKVTTTTAASSSSSSAAGGAAASSALAKFNRIIDSTMERPQATTATAVAATLPQLSSATLQQRFNLAYPELVTQQQQQQQQQHQSHDADKQKNSSLKGNQRLDRGSGAVASTPLTFQAHKSLATATENEQVWARREEDPQGQPLDESAGEDYGPNDDDHPHHDEDNQMKRNDVHYLLKQLNSFSDIEEIEIVDMKQREQQQRQWQRHGQGQGQGHGQSSEQPRPIPMASSSLVTMVLPNSPTPASPSTQSHKLGVSSLLLPQHQHQFDDYLFESCHYLETNYFAATYRTAMVESSSHEFRPSTNSSSNSFELHEMEPPSVICKAAPPPPPPAAPPEYRQLETRLTTSGVQTELTAESLAKLSNSTSSSSTRAPPFFRCCYTPIDRWREKRQQKSSSTPGSGSGCGSGSAPPKNV